MRFGYRRWRWPLGLAALAAVAVGAVHPLPVCACVEPRTIVESFADAPPDASPAALEAGFERRIQACRYTFAMLPPDLRAHCTASEHGDADCRLVTHDALLRERGLQLTFAEDADGFIAEVDVHPFSRWRVDPAAVRRRVRLRRLPRSPA